MIAEWLDAHGGAVQLRAARRRRDRLRALPPRDQLDRAGHAAARREERADRARRSFRHGRLSAHRLRRPTRPTCAQGLDVGCGGAAGRELPRPRDARSRCSSASATSRGASSTLLDERRDASRATATSTARIVGIATRRHGSAFSATAARGTLADVEPAGASADAARLSTTSTFIRDAARRERAPPRGSGAWSSSKRPRWTSSAASRRSSHVRAALAGGAHVDHRQQGAGGVRVPRAGARGRSAPDAGSCSKAR